MVGVLVVDDSHGFGRNTVVGIAATGQGRAHPHKVAGLSGGLNNNIGPLTNTKSDKVGLVWLDFDEVVGDDGHLVVVDAELLDTLGTGVDEAEEVLLARLEAEFRNTSVRRAGVGGVSTWVVHLAVDQVVVGERRKTGLGVHDLPDQVEVLVVEPVREDDRSLVLIVLRVRRTMDDHSSEGTAGVLCAVVTVVPGCTVKVGLEPVSERTAWGDGALLD